MRKALFFASAIALTVATLATKPAQALPWECGCYCVNYPTLQCGVPGGGTTTCAAWARSHCLA